MKSFIKELIERGRSALIFKAGKNNSANIVLTDDDTFKISHNAVDVLTSRGNNLELGKELILDNITLDTSRFNTGVTPASEPSGLVWWSDADRTVNIATGLGPVLQVGQEEYTKVHNNTGGLLENGKVVSAVAGISALGIPYVDYIKADSESFASVELIAVITQDIAHGEWGFGTLRGNVRGVDTSGVGTGLVYLSDTNAGELVNTPPEFPSYKVQIGGVLVSDEDNGVLYVARSGGKADTFQNFWNGTFRESFSFTVSESGGTVTGTLTPTNGNVDMTMIFSDGFSLLDTDPPATIVLTPGTDSVPVTNYVYVLKSTKALTVSTSAWPAAEHIKVSEILLRSAATTGTEDPLRNQNWNDHIQASSTNMGHLSHITQKLRKFEAQWESGCELSAVHRTTPAPDELYVTVTGGQVYQLHPQTFPSFDTEAADDIHVFNHPTTPFLTIKDLATQIIDANSGTLANKHYSVVIWGGINKSGEASHIFMNLPTGSYNSAANAISDPDNYAIYTIPPSFAGVGFLIARLVLSFGAGTATITVQSTEDLRGKLPNTSAGGGSIGGAGVTTFTALTDVPAAYASQALKVPRVNSGETALEFTDSLPAYSGALTDGAPTDGEIDTITGTTPAAVGSGWAATILDTTGSTLMYIITSDGTNWQYFVGAIAT